MTHVIKKRTGKVQKFSKAKIVKAIEKSAKDAKLSVTKTNQLIEEISKPVSDFVKTKKQIHASDLRQSVLGRLARRSKKAYNEWVKYDKHRKNQLQ